ncbi:MAG: hemerythrin domain-containing protein [Pirellulaceae bacterium]|nr:hemerythrin domain-containing protein [Pirellulaceae bacterium]
MKHETYLLIRNNHAIIDELLATAERTLPEQQTAASEVADLLDRLQQHVTARFQEEVENELFNSLIAMAPRLQHAIDLLRQDHEQLLKLLNTLCEQAKSENLGRQERDALEQMFQKFSDLYNAHEQREQDLILAAYDDDLGRGD